MKQREGWDENYENILVYSRYKSVKSIKYIII